MTAGRKTDLIKTGNLDCITITKEALRSNGLGASLFLEMLYNGGNVVATVI